MSSSIKKTGLFFGSIVAISLLTFSGCARIGNDFNSHRVEQIKVDETSQSDIVLMFGQPWRKGMENGITMWTYGRYTYRLIGETDTKDLVIKFNKDGKVSSYTFNSTVNEK
ncbi:hypothetical protein [Sulfurimonas sp.]|uniref:hypothetical protein n=1 Tax=Sulfurimonas sp. TaxID=2022749 RepID=UPI0025D6BD06|nr:hypothetical protein [Sulfurimonas sp.]MDD5157695.1 hypothetical protein [Sulfurimonas sp.]